MDKLKASAVKNSGPSAMPAPKGSAPAAKTSSSAVKAPSSQPKPGPSSLSQRVPPLFRRIDWLALVGTFLFVFIGYLLTIAPEMTLEDSGELATGSFYAGVPHPPGYPVWTIFTWLWTKLLPFNNIAWRVGVGCAFSGALASGM